MPRQQNPFANHGTGANFSGPGYGYTGGGPDLAGGISTLARALFAAPALRQKADVDQAHSDYYKALTAKNGIEVDKLNNAEGARSSIADMYRQVPGLMAARNVQGPTPSGETVDEVATQSLANMPSQIAAAATRLPASEQGQVGNLFLFQNANNPASSDASVARSVVGAGHLLGKDQAVSLPDREAVAARDQAGKMAVENVQSADRQRGQDIGAETTRRGQDVGAETSRRGQDVGAETARRGQDVGAETSRRGQDVGAETARRGQDINEELKRLKADAATKVTPADYRRYVGILNDVGGKSDAGDTIYEPDAEAAIVGRAAELYQSSKDAVGSTRQALMELTPQLERRDSSYNPLSKRRFGLKGGGTVADAMTSPAAAPAAAAPPPPTATAAPGASGSAAGKHQPGDFVTVGGVLHKVGPDGDTLIPVQ